MVTECVEALLNCQLGKKRRAQKEDIPLLFIDATLGGGGHTQALLDQLAHGDVVFGVDVDAEALHTASLRLANYLPTSHPLSSSQQSLHQKEKKGRLPLFVPIQSNFKDLCHIIQNMIQKYCGTAAITPTDETAASNTDSTINYGRQIYETYYERWRFK
jgi:hypothetical protein